MTPIPFKIIFSELANSGVTLPAHGQTYPPPAAPSFIAEQVVVHVEPLAVQPPRRAVTSVVFPAQLQVLRGTTRENSSGFRDNRLKVTTSLIQGFYQKHVRTVFDFWPIHQIPNYDRWYQILRGASLHTRQ